MQYMKIADLLKSSGLDPNSVPEEIITRSFHDDARAAVDKMGHYLIGAILNAMDEVYYNLCAAHSDNEGSTLTANTITEYGIADIPLFLSAKAERDAARIQLGVRDLPESWYESWIDRTSKNSGEKIEKREEVTIEAKIVRTSEEKRVAYAVVYSPVEKMGTDSYGDWMTAEHIEKMAWNFLAKGITRSTDTEHSFVQNGCEIVESFIVRHGDPDFPDDEGAWVVAVRVNDDTIWEAIKSGEYAGVSLAGITTKVYPAEAMAA